MPLINSSESTKPPKHTKHEAAAGVRIAPGPFVGIIKNNVDSMRQGRVQVWIPELGGYEDDESSWRTVSYTTPFYGATDPNLRSKDQGFVGSPHSYGFWMVTPDIGVKVLCIFVNGDPFKGYWFSCIPEWPNMHMVPGMSSASWHGGGPDPVVDYNDLDPAATGTEAQFYSRAQTTHDYQKGVWAKQGLLQDKDRGPGISSAFRETPSRVFGFSTPGPELSLPSGQDPDNVNLANLSAIARQGGHQLVMDDGTVDGKSQLIRLRTSNGNMLLMNDSAGFIYLINSAGTAWFEMDGAGNVRIFAQGKVETHAQQGFVFETPGSVNISGNQIDIAAKGPLKISGSTVDILGEKGVKVGGDGDLHLLGKKALLTGKSCVGISGKEHIDLKAGCITLNTRKVTEASKPGKASPQEGPTHEPYSGHQNTKTNTPTTSASYGSTSGVPSGAAGTYGAAGSFGNTADVPQYYGVLTNASGPIKFNPGLQGSLEGQAVNLGDAATLNTYDENSASYLNVTLQLPVSAHGFSVNTDDGTARNNTNLKPGEALNNPGDLGDLTSDPFAIGQTNGLNIYSTGEEGIAALSLLLDLIQQDGAATISDFLQQYLDRKAST